jgi:hypothetical protein
MTYQFLSEENPIDHLKHFTPTLDIIEVAFPSEDSPSSRIANRHGFLYLLPKANPA